MNVLKTSGIDLVYHILTQASACVWRPTREIFRMISQTEHGNDYMVPVLYIGYVRTSNLTDFTSKTLS